jgi:ATP-binding cassette subfamily B protein
MKGKEWGAVCLCLIFITAQVFLDLKLPDYMASITTLVTTEGNTVNEILHEGTFMLLCAFGSFASSIFVGFIAAGIAASFAARLRSLQFGKVSDFSMNEINQFSTPSLITRSTNDVTQIQMIIAVGLQVLIKAPITAVWAITKIMGKSWQWTAATGVAVAFLLLIITCIILFAMPKFKIIQKLTDNLNSVTRENLTGLRVVRAYNAEDYEKDKFEKANTELTNTNLFTMRLMAVMMPGISVVSNGLNLAIYWIGAYVLDAAAMTEKTEIFSNMVVFTAYAMQIILSFMMMSMIFILLPRASVAAGRIKEVLNTKATIKDGTKEEADENIKGKLEFRDVCFRYPDAEEYMLKDINFTANPGETVAFIGSTGSGKSSIVKLIPRFYDATEGQVLLDETNVREYTLEALHDKIGYVPQKAVLFSGTVDSNVSYGDSKIVDYSEDAVKKAVAIAQSTDFVEKMDGKYEGNIAQGGSNVSGGQKQRLSIARAVYRDPEILVFDDSFSALDYKTDRKLRSVIKSELEGKTMIIVAQRIGTIIDADQIMVIDNGEIVGHGTHKELLKNNDIYREIAYSQLSQKELEDANE